MTTLLTCWIWLRTRLASGARWLAHGGRWKVAVGAMTALCAALSITFLLYRVREYRAKTNALSVALAASQGEVRLLRDARAADAAALAQRDGQRSRVIQKEAIGRAKTSAAIAANPDWASEPIPAAVADSLRE